MPKLTPAQQDEVRAEGRELKRVRAIRGLTCGDLRFVCRETWPAQRVGKWESGVMSMPRKLWQKVFEEWGGRKPNPSRLTPFPEDEKRQRRKRRAQLGKTRPTWKVDERTRLENEPIRNPFIAPPTKETGADNPFL